MVKVPCCCICLWSSCLSLALLDICYGVSLCAILQNHAGCTTFGSLLFPSVSILFKYSPLYILTKNSMSSFGFSSVWHLLTLPSHSWDSLLWILGWLLHVTWVWLLCIQPSSPWFCVISCFGLLMHVQWMFCVPMVPCLLTALWYINSDPVGRKGYLCEYLSLCLIEVVCLLVQYGYFHHYCILWEVSLIAAVDFLIFC